MRTSVIPGLVGLLVLAGCSGTPASDETSAGSPTAASTTPRTSVTSPAGPGLPSVVLDDGVPSAIITEGEPPDALAVTLLRTGDGPVTEAGQTVAVQYTGWLWDGTKFDSSWDRGSPFSFTVGAGEVIDGWDEGVVGQPVGSQVLLVIPPDKGYGDRDLGTIPPGSTLVFVVDVLAVF